MKAANRHHDEVVALGLGAYDLALRKVHKKIELSQLATHASARIPLPTNARSDESCLLTLSASPPKGPTDSRWTGLSLGSRRTPSVAILRATCCTLVRFPNYYPVVYLDFIMQAKCLTKQLSWRRGIKEEMMMEKR